MSGKNRPSDLKMYKQDANNPIPEDKLENSENMLTGMANGLVGDHKSNNREPGEGTKENVEPLD
jgi:hypothetical protein